MPKTDWHDINDPGHLYKPTPESPASKKPNTGIDPDSEQPKEPTKPEVSFVSGRFEPHPTYGYALNSEAVVSGSVSLLVEKTTFKKLTLDLFAIYENIEENLKINQTKYGTASINDDLTFRFPGVPLYCHSKYPYNEKKEFVKPVRYKAVITNGRQDKPFEIVLDLPVSNAKKPVDLKEGMYDDKAHNARPGKYPADPAQGYVLGTPIYNLQLTLEDYRYLAKGTANGVFGPKTDEAVKQFQTDSLQKLRVDREGGKLVETPNITYNGQSDGIVGSMTRNELEQWKLENYLRPLPNLYYGDYDKEAVKQKVKSDPRGYAKDAHAQGQAQQDDYHEVGTPVVNFQKFLAEIGAYDGKQDGWFADKTKVAIALFQDCAEKGEFINANEEIITLPEDERIPKIPKGSATIAVQEAVKKAAAKKLKVVPKGALSDSVGQGGANKSEDVQKVKQKLKDLGYPVKDVSEILSPEDIKAIKLFQVFNKTIPMGLVTVDGRIDKGGKTEAALFGKNPKKYDPPKKGAVKPLAPGIEKKKNDAINGKDESMKKIWQRIMNVWDEVSPYLPEGTRMESGYRTKDEQRKQLYDKYEGFRTKISEKYTEKEWRQNLDDSEDQSLTEAKRAVLDTKMHDQISKAISPREVAAPGHSRHEKGQAIDTQASPVDSRARALLWFEVEFVQTRPLVNITKESNSCIHFEFT